uniref:Uncharacterized protein n=2 Tax=Opuntia streptacantha TaxID=393608 RepID=A0A7C8YD02_OPUST
MEMLMAWLLNWPYCATAECGQLKWTHSTGDGRIDKNKMTDQSTNYRLSHLPLKSWFTITTVCRLLCLCSLCKSSSSNSRLFKLQLPSLGGFGGFSASFLGGDALLLSFLRRHPATEACRGALSHCFSLSSPSSCAPRSSQLPIEKFRSKFEFILYAIFWEIYL